MSNNSYNDFKNGIRNDVRSYAINSFAALGALSFVFVMLFILGYVLYKPNGFTGTTKLITGSIVLCITCVLIFNRKAANFIYLSWLRLILYLAILLIVVLCGGFLYLLFKPYFTNFF
jgi:hypothetical protein